MVAVLEKMVMFNLKVNCPRCTKTLVPVRQYTSSEKYTPTTVYTCNNDTCVVFEVIVDLETKKVIHYNLKE